MSLLGRCGFETGHLPATVTVALDDDVIGIVCEAVECALCKDGVVEQRDPFLHTTIASEDRGRATMSFDDNLVDVVGACRVESPQCKIIDDEQFGGEKASEYFFEGVVGSGLSHLFEHRVGTNKDHIMTCATGRVSEGRGEEGLSHSHRPEKQHILLGLDKVKGE